MEAILSPSIVILLIGLSLASQACPIICLIRMPREHLGKAAPHIFGRSRLSLSSILAVLGKGTRT